MTHRANSQIIYYKTNLKYQINSWMTEAFHPSKRILLYYLIVALTDCPKQREAILLLNVSIDCSPGLGRQLHLQTGWAGAVAALGKGY